MTHPQSEGDRQGLSHCQLCDRFGWSYHQIAQTAQQIGLSTHAYLHHLTRWQIDRERWYPPAFSSLTNETKY